MASQAKASLLKKILEGEVLDSDTFIFVALLLLILMFCLLKKAGLMLIIKKISYSAYDLLKDTLTKRKILSCLKQIMNIIDFVKEIKSITKLVKDVSTLVKNNIFINKEKTKNNLILKEKKHIIIPNVLIYINGSFIINPCWNLKVYILPYIEDNYQINTPLLRRRDDSVSFKSCLFYKTKYIWANDWKFN